MPDSTALALFAGVGSGLGARELGIEEDGVEKMSEAVATRDALGLKTTHDDCWTFDYGKAYYKGLTAGPPCQTFSMAGKGAGREALDNVLDAIRTERWHDVKDLREVGREVGDERTALVLLPLHAWWLMRPEWVAFEQVPTVQPVWDACASVMKDNGYNVWTGKLHAEQYGVPQTRTRSVLIGSRIRAVGKPVPTHSLYYPHNPSKLDRGFQKWVSMAEALGWDEGFRMVSSYGSGGDPKNRGVRKGTQPAPAVTSKIDRNIVYRSTPMPNSAVRPLSSPAPTVVIGHEPPRWIKDSESVRVTVSEAGLLQSFPWDTPWQGAKGKQFLQVGNAAPPGLVIPVLGEATGIPWEPVNERYLNRIYERV